MKRLGFGTVTAREDGDIAALVAEFAGEFFDDGRLAGAADGDVANGDDLDAEGGVAQDADLVEKEPRLDRHGENRGGGILSLDP